MQRYTLLILSILFYNSFAYSQNPSWDWTHFATGNGVDQPHDIAIDTNGNVCITGEIIRTITINGTTINSKTNGFYSVFILKTDPSGNIIWANVEGGTNHSGGKSIATDANNNVYVTGYFSRKAYFGNDSATANGDSDIFLIKYDSNGNLLWLRTAGCTTDVYQGDMGTSVGVDANNDVYITGHFESTAYFGNDSLIAVGNKDVFLAKYNTNGVLQWTTSVKGPNGILWPVIDVKDSIVLSATGYGDIYFPNDTIYAQGNIGSAFVSKYDLNGNFHWMREMGGTQNLPRPAIAVDSLRNIYYATSISDTFDIDGIKHIPNQQLSPNFSDILLVKFDVNGNTQWVRQAGGKLNDIGYNICVDPKCNQVVLSGYVDDNAIFSNDSVVVNGLQDFYVCKYDQQGTLIWLNQTVNADGVTEAYLGGDIAMNSAGHIYMAANFRNSMVVGTDTGYAAGNDITMFLSRLSDHGTQSDCNFIYTTANDELMGKGVMVYPNPTSDRMVVDVRSTVHQIDVYDYAGKRIRSINQPNREIEVSNLPTGLYIMKVYTPEGVLTTKFVKQ